MIRNFDLPYKPIFKHHKHWVTNINTLFKNTIKEAQEDKMLNKELENFS